ncbi:hypothetical protein ACF0H5_003777 [Mactra antiquata]
MASSNVEYYERQKELQDTILENEQKRKRLEAQLQAHSQFDNKLVKLRAVKLQSYWKRICDDEKKSKQRNAQLLRSMDHMEANLASLDARREKLKHMKQQYFDYIERTYPKWLELVRQHQQESQQQHHQQQSQQFSQQQQQQQQQNPQQQQQYNYQQQQYQEEQRYQQQQQQQQQQWNQSQQQQKQQSQYNRNDDNTGTSYGVPPPPLADEETLPKQQEAFGPPIIENGRNMYQDEDTEEEETPPPLPSQPPPPVVYNGPEREYTNISEMRRDAQMASASQPQSVTVRIPGQGDHGEGNVTAQSGRPDSGRRSEQPGQSWLAAERDLSTHSVSFSEDVEIPIQPIQSVTVRQKTDQPVQLPAQISDDDVSDFGSEQDLPSGTEIQPIIDTVTKPPSPVQAAADDDDDDDTDQTPSVVHPDVTTIGLYKLMKFVEEEVLNALALEGFYRSRYPDEGKKKEIIYKANNEGSTLATLDGELVSMVLLQQLTLVLRRLPGGCMLSDTLLSRGDKSLTDIELRSNLHRDALALWDRLLDHFVLLVKNRVMGTREVAHVFVPCLVHEGSEYQNTAVTVIETVIEHTMDKTNGRTSPIQDSTTLDTARSSQQGGDHFMNINLAVPPLMFGSLVDSKPFSDDESSMITQSMNTDVQRVPLNETDAYKSLVSGSQPAVRQISPDDTDNSDNELEKQIASTLSPRSRQSKPIVDPYPEAPPSVPKDESQDDLSHDQEPESEVSSPTGAPVYVPTGAEQSTLKSVLGSTGGSSQQRKLAGLIHSDLDTDTELDLDNMVQKKPEDDLDDDFHDFYQ